MLILQENSGPCSVSDWCYLAVPILVSVEKQSQRVLGAQAQVSREKEERAQPKGRGGEVLISITRQRSLVQECHQAVEKVPERTCVYPTSAKCIRLQETCWTCTQNLQRYWVTGCKPLSYFLTPLQRLRGNIVLVFIDCFKN